MDTSNTEEFNSNVDVYAEDFAESRYFNMDSEIENSYASILISHIKGFGDQPILGAIDFLLKINVQLRSMEKCSISYNTSSIAASILLKVQSQSTNSPNNQSLEKALQGISTDRYVRHRIYPMDIFINTLRNYNPSIFTASTLKLMDKYVMNEIKKHEKRGI